MRVSAKLMYLWLFVWGTLSLAAQELNAVVTIDSRAIQRSDRQLFTSMQEAVHTFINDRQWTRTGFRANERIDCSFTIVLKEMTSDNTFNAELLVQSRRPVYNATYATPLLNFRDTEFSFDYMEYQPLEYQPDRITGNLQATLAFYIYLIIGLDFDSMSPLGGSDYFRTMQQIVQQVQPNNWAGWESRGKNRNRYALAQAFSDASQESFRNMWYSYHRLGLDRLADYPDDARRTVAEAVPVLASLYTQRPTSALLTVFGDTKLGELCNVLSTAVASEKQNAYNTLQRIYPTRTRELEKIKQSN
ncbi:MAG TPA: DUF4835 domain-containing protein [Porphyromonadaceae bacterium]|jgi:hypothetical protein|nr:DUF4835 domain-containing protein [Porphyromonadaceae bacterium]